MHNWCDQRSADDHTIHKTMTVKLTARWLPPKIWQSVSHFSTHRLETINIHTLHKLMKSESSWSGPGGQCRIDRFPAAQQQFVANSLRLQNKKTEIVSILWWNSKLGKQTDRFAPDHDDQQRASYIREISKAYTLSVVLIITSLSTLDSVESETLNSARFIYSCVLIRSGMWAASWPIWSTYFLWTERSVVFWSIFDLKSSSIS